MHEWLRVLYAEQTGPDEIVVFLLIGAAAAFVLAFLIYAIVLVALWRWRIGSAHSLGALIFPSRARLRRYAAEYAVAATTGLLLSFTVATRHAVVEAVLARDIGEIGQEAVLSALPFGMPSHTDLTEAGADSAAASEFIDWLRTSSAGDVGIRADDFLRPLLNAGLIENGTFLAQAAVRGLEIEESGTMIQRILLAVAIALLIGYAVWFGWQRVREVQQRGEADPEYSEIAKRLAVPALCIPLLLISATKLDDPDRIARSAAAAASLSASESANLWMDSLIAQQAVRTRQSFLYEQMQRQDSSAIALLTLFRERMDSIEADFAALATSFEALESRLRGDIEDAQSARLELQEALDDLAADLATLQQNLDDVALAHADTQEELADRMEALRTRLATSAQEAQRALAAADAQGERLTGLEQTVGRLREIMAANQEARPAYLLVVNDQGGAHAIQNAGGQVIRRGTGRYVLHAIAPGTYVMQDQNFQPNRVTLSAGSAAAVFRPVIIE